LVGVRKGNEIEAYGIGRAYNPNNLGWLVSERETRLKLEARVQDGMNLETNYVV
jgi:hypothetical protein